MKISCEVIRDLIPLYAEGMLSDDSMKLVESHLEDCEDCRSMLEEWNQPYHTPLDTNALPLLKVKAALRKKKIIAIMVTLVFTLLFSAILFAFVTTPKYLPYSQDTVQINEQSDGSIVATFSESVSGYQIDGYSMDGDSNVSYHLTAWTTILDEYFFGKKTDTVVLNAADESVRSVYYYQTDGSEDQLIYGSDETLYGGSISLPRLNLAYYLMTAILFGGVSLVVALLFRKRRRVFELSYKAFFMPVSYVIGHLIVMGNSSASYHSTRDLLAIILIAMPLCALILLGIKLYAISRERKQIEKVN